MGAAARAERLLGDGGAAARISLGEGDVQPGAVAARAARGVRARAGARPPPRARTQAGRPAHGRGARLLRRAFLPRAPRPDDRTVSALPRAPRTAGKRERA